VGGLLHGQLDAERKGARMRAVSAARIDVLVSTTGDRVEWNMPRYHMVVEHAERFFGISQADQLRGRMTGRGKSFMLADTGLAISQFSLLSPEGEKRLDTMVRNKMIEIAEMDLSCAGGRVTRPRRRQGHGLTCGSRKTCCATGRYGAAKREAVGSCQAKMPPITKQDQSR